MSDFEAFTDKGRTYITAKTASVTMNSHGNINFPGSVVEGLFDNDGYVEYLTNQREELLAFRTYADEESAPEHAYTLSKAGPDGTSNNATAPVAKVLESMGKQVPDEHTMFEIEDVDGHPSIDVSKLPDIEDND